MNLGVEMKGMRALRRGIKLFDDQLPKTIRAGMIDAIKPVAEEMRQAFPKKTGRAAKTIRTGANASAALIRAGGKSVPYFGWIEFGGRLPAKRPRTKKALAWPGGGPVARVSGAMRPVSKDGRTIYPIAEKRRGEVAERIGDVLITNLEGLTAGGD